MSERKLQLAWAPLLRNKANLLEPTLIYFLSHLSSPFHFQRLVPSVEDKMNPSLKIGMFHNNMETNANTNKKLTFLTNLHLTVPIYFHNLSLNLWIMWSSLKYILFDVKYYIIVNWKQFNKSQRNHHIEIHELLDESIC